MKDKENQALKRILEDFKPELPKDDIICKTCIFRKPDLKEGKKVIVKGYKNAYCEIYKPDISGKPNGILFNGEDCKYYRKE